jgi:putative Holliday junction resolvase
LTLPSGRALGLDLGSVRVGVALSDPLGLTAQPFGLLKRRELNRDLAPLLAIVASHDVTTIVVGHPLLLSGAEGASAADAARFVERVAPTVGIPVVLWDERLTTVQAERALREGGVRGPRRRELVDAAAAALMLQSWLDRFRGS